VWVNRVDDVWRREGVGQPSRRRLTEGMCGSTETTTFDWGKVWVNRVDDVWLREGVGQPSRRRLTEGRCGSTEWTMFDWRKVWVNRAKNLWLTLDKYRVLDRDEKISFLQQLQCARLLVWMKQYFSYIVEVCFNSGWNLSTGLQKTTDLTQVTDRLFHIMLCRVHLAWAGFEHTTLVVMCSWYTIRLLPRRSIS
jgi:hypothetical protein